MKIPAFIRLTIRNIIVNIDIGTLIFMLGLPTLYLFVMGFMFQGIVTTGVPLQSGGSVSYTTFLAPGIIALESFTAGNIGGSMLWSDRRWGMFERIMVGPFRRIDYLLGIITVSIIFALVGSLIMLGFSLLIPISVIVTPESIVKQLAKSQPLRVVFRDAGFKDSAIKINVEQIFKLLSPATEVKCI